MNKEILEYAQKYRAIGWNVIPLYDYSKNPSSNFFLPEYKDTKGNMVRGWLPLKDRRVTDEEFNLWFVDKNPTGLGVVTGAISGIVVVDEDSYKAGGKAVTLNSPMLSLTARHGKHYFFKYTEAIKTSGFRKGVNVEIKSDGGFIVLPPSEVITEPITKYTGKYEWLMKCRMEDLPTITEGQLTDYRGDSFGKAVDLKDVTGAAEGDRHNNLRTFALAIFNRFNPKEWQIAEDMVRFEATKQNPPLPDKQMERLIADCKQFVSSHPKEEKKPDQKAVAKPRTVNEIANERISDRALEKTAPKTMWPELDAIIKGLVPGHIHTWTGDTNVGKTALACNVSVRVEQQGKKVLYIALEPDVNVVEYLASIRHKKKFSELTDEDLKVPEDQEHIKFLLSRDIEKIEDLLRVLDQEEHYDLIVIDHIGYFVHSEKDWLQQQANIIKQLASMAKVKKTCVIIIAHLRKPSGSPKAQKEWVPSQNDIAGSAAFKQDSTEVIIAVRKTKEADEFSVQFDDEGWLLVTKTKAGPNGTVKLWFREQSAYITTAREADKDEKDRAELTAMLRSKQASLLDESKDLWDKSDDDDEIGDED